MSGYALVAAGGWAGTAGLLLGYALVSTGRLTGESRRYQLLNVAGSIGLGVAAFAGRVWPAVTVNAIWVAIGMWSLLRRGAAGAGDAR